MKINGYQLREALKQWELHKDTATQQFTPSLKFFEGDDKPVPEDIVAQCLKAETSIAQLQVAQMRYNLAVTVQVEGVGTMTLAEAIKRVGGSGRIEKMWKDALPKAPDRYALTYDDTRDPSMKRAQATISTEDILGFASASSKRAGAFRAAIATGNAQVVEIEDLDAALFE